MSIYTHQNTDDMQSYLRKVWTYPMLSASKEKELLLEFYHSNCSVAAEQLITSHLRLVVKIAMNAKGYGLPVEDLIAEGNVGLLKGLHKFEPEKEVRLSTYAMWWIKAFVNDFILKNWSMVPLGTVSAQKKLFFSIRRIKRELEIYDNGELTKEQAAQVAIKANASVRDVQQINNRLSARDQSLNAPIGEDTSFQHLDMIEDCSPNQEQFMVSRQQDELKEKALKTALRRLEKRDREIVKARYFSEEPSSLKELGNRFGISSERVRQLEVRAIETITSFIQNHVKFGKLCHERT